MRKHWTIQQYYLLPCSVSFHPLKLLNREAACGTTELAHLSVLVLSTLILPLHSISPPLDPCLSGCITSLTMSLSFFARCVMQHAETALCPTYHQPCLLDDLVWPFVSFTDYILHYHYIIMCTLCAHSSGTHYLTLSFLNIPYHNCLELRWICRLGQGTSEIKCCECEWHHHHKGKCKWGGPLSSVGLVCHRTPHHVPEMTESSLNASELLIIISEFSKSSSWSFGLWILQRCTGRDTNQITSALGHTWNRTGHLPADCCLVCDHCEDSPLDFNQMATDSKTLWSLHIRHSSKLDMSALVWPTTTHACTQACDPWPSTLPNFQLP